MVVNDDDIIHSSLFMTKAHSIKEVLHGLKGTIFKAVGPFLVADFTKDPTKYTDLNVASHGTEVVHPEKVTESHSHEFVSLYKSVGLNVMVGGEEIVLPEKALTIVFPGTEHSWVAQDKAGTVGSVDERHEKQVMVNRMVVA